MLYRRLIGLDEPKLSVHQFHAAMHEVHRGLKTGAEFAVIFGLDAGEIVEMQALVGRIGFTGGKISPEELHQVLLLAEQQKWYGTEVLLKARLGV